MTLTDLQKQKFKAMFTALDANKNGVLERTDFVRIAHRMAELRGYKPGSAQHGELEGMYSMLWSAYDTANEGKVSLDKFYAFFEMVLPSTAKYGEALQPMIDGVFKLLDVDGDGRVSVDEYKTFLKAYDLDVSDAEKRFAAWDKNSDGFLSKGEVNDLCTAYYMGSDPKAPENLLFGNF